MKSRFLFLSVVVILSSCAEFIQPSHGPLEDVEFNSSDGREFNIIGSVFVENQNKYGFRVKAKRITVMANGKEFAKVRLSNKVKIKKSSAEDKPFEVSIKLVEGASIMKLGARSLLTRRPIKVKVTGKVKGCRCIFCKSVPIEYEKDIDPNQLQQLIGN